MTKLIAGTVVMILIYEDFEGEHLQGLFKVKNDIDLPKMPENSDKWKYAEELMKNENLEPIAYNHLVITDIELNICKGKPGEVI